MHGAGDLGDGSIAFDVYSPRICKVRVCWCEHGVDRKTMTAWRGNSGDDVLSFIFKSRNDGFLKHA